MGKLHCYEYPRPSVTTDSVIFKHEKGETNLLLIKRKNEPFKDMWAFPGGFLEMDEDTKTGAARELYEETGINCQNLIQSHVADKVDRDPRGRILSVIYCGYHFDMSKEARAMDDASEAKWHNINKLPTLAGDHLQILREVIIEFSESINLGTHKFHYICNLLTATEKHGLLQDFKLFSNNTL